MAETNYLDLFEDAERKGSKARIAMFGVEGSGKTTAAIEMAKQFARSEKNIYLIDTERGAAQKFFAPTVAGGDDGVNYANLNWGEKFDGVFNPVVLTDVINQVTKSPDVDVLIIDSLSHFWSEKGGTLQQVDRAKRTDKGDTSGWNHGSRIQGDLYSALLGADCHIILTMRAKKESVVFAKKKGEGDPSVRNLGLNIVQRDTLLYELDVVAAMEQHNKSMLIIKSRITEIDGRETYTVEQTADTARLIRDWLGGAEATEARTEQAEALQEMLITEPLPEEVNDDLYEDVPVSVIDAEQVGALVAIFDGIEDADARTAAKQEFVKGVGSPQEITTDALESATKLANDLVAASN